MYGGEVSGGKCVRPCPKCGAEPETQTIRYCPGNGGFACDTTPRHESEAFHIVCAACSYRYLASVDQPEPESRKAPRAKRAR